MELNNLINNLLAILSKRFSNCLAFKFQHEQLYLILLELPYTHKHFQLLLQFHQMFTTKCNFIKLAVRAAAAYIVPILFLTLASIVPLLSASVPRYFNRLTKLIILLSIKKILLCSLLL